MKEANILIIRGKFPLKRYWSNTFESAQNIKYLIVREQFTEILQITSTRSLWLRDKYVNFYEN
jgi:hypothetical protein